MRSHFKTFAIASTALLALAACTSPQNPGRAAWNVEAGGLVDGGTFGNSTMNNMLYQSGERGYVSDLSGRFASEVQTSVTFAFNSAQLDAAARTVLRRQASWIRQFPEIRFRVYGHTDAVGSNRYNQRLGHSRAQAVVAYLASQGISRSRLEALVSYGETQPLVVSQGRERRNRRTVTEVSGFVGSHPTVMNGKYAEVVFREYVESARAPSQTSEVDGAEFSTGQ
ncbi:OmpA family protein [Algirhabdus cladophorae]|uniref:OmpA family protein n=1 Tax=Algirhabdus cladophorae TaxID=3377108 RepID=UPI003B845EF3